MKKYNFRNLVFEGGGVKGIAYVGALEVLEQKEILPSIIRVAGTSAGAITAGLLAAGFNSDEIFDIMKNTNFKKFKSGSIFPFFNLYRLYKNFGLFKSDALQEWFEETISKKLNKNITFKELAKLSKGDNLIKELYVVGANLNQRKEMVFSHKTVPNMKISEAIRISMSIPLYFEAIKKGKEVYADGYIFYDYPLDIFDNKKFLDNKRNFWRIPDVSEDKKVFNRETIGLHVSDLNEIQNQVKNKNYKGIKVHSLRQYMRALTGSILDLANKRHLHEKDWKRSIGIDSLGIGATEFNLSEKEKKRLVTSGKKAAEDYFKDSKKNKI